MYWQSWEMCTSKTAKSKKGLRRNSKWNHVVEVTFGLIRHQSGLCGGEEIDLMSAFTYKSDYFVNICKPHLLAFLISLLKWLRYFTYPRECLVHGNLFALYLSMSKLKYGTEAGSHENTESSLRKATVLRGISASVCTDMRWFHLKCKEDTGKLFFNVSFKRPRGKNPTEGIYRARAFTFYPFYTSSAPPSNIPNCLMVSLKSALSVSQCFTESYFVTPF